MNKVVLLSLLVALNLGRLAAQEEADVLSVPALDKTTFTITVSPRETTSPPPKDTAGGSKAPKSTVVSITVTRYDTLQQNITHSSDGSKVEDWLSGRIYVSRNPFGGWLNTVSLDMYTFRGTMPFITLRDFFNWVGPAALVGKKSYNGQPANLFHKKDAEFPQVWLAPKTGLPIAYIDGDGTYSFTFAPPPTAPLIIPPEYAKELTRYSQMAAPAH